jgi:hypothetical protein
LGRRFGIGPALTLSAAKRNVKHTPATAVWRGLILKKPEQERAFFSFGRLIAAVEIPK